MLSGIVLSQLELFNFVTKTIFVVLSLNILH